MMGPMSETGVGGRIFHIPNGGGRDRLGRGGGWDRMKGGKRPFRKRSCRSKSRCGGAGAANYGWWNNPFPFNYSQVNFLGGGKRTFRKRSCRSKSRCGGAGAANDRWEVWGLGGSRGGKWWNNHFPFD